MTTKLTDRHCLASIRVFFTLLLIVCAGAAVYASPAGGQISLSADSVDVYDILEVTLQVESPDAANPFVDVSVTGVFGSRGVEPVRVDGSSMKDTLIHNEYMFVEKMTYWFREPERGEIITCFYPGYTVSCVKRVIAVGGDTISIWGGTVYVNGTALVEDYWNGMLANMDAVTVPEGHVFVMGDNRGDSKDSRMPSVGTIPLYRIVGKCRAVIWPLSERRKI